MPGHQNHPHRLSALEPSSCRDQPLAPANDLRADRPPRHPLSSSSLTAWSPTQMHPDSRTNALTCPFLSRSRSPEAGPKTTRTPKNRARPHTHLVVAARLKPNRRPPESRRTKPGLPLTSPPPAWTLIADGPKPCVDRAFSSPPRDREERNAMVRSCSSKSVASPSRIMSPPQWQPEPMRSGSC